MISPSGAARRALRGISSLAGFDQPVRRSNVRSPIDFPFPEGLGPPGALEFGKATSHVQRPRDRWSAVEPTPHKVPK